MRSNSDPPFLRNEFIKIFEDFFTVKRSNKELKIKDQTYCVPLDSSGVYAKVKLMQIITLSYISKTHPIR